MRTPPLVYWGLLIAIAIGIYVVALAVASVLTLLLGLTGQVIFLDYVYDWVQGQNLWGALRTVAELVVLLHLIQLGIQWARRRGYIA